MQGGKYRTRAISVQREYWRCPQAGESGGDLDARTHRCYRALSHC